MFGRSQVRWIDKGTQVRITRDFVNRAAAERYAAKLILDGNASVTIRPRMGPVIRGEKHAA